MHPLEKIANKRKLVKGLSDRVPPVPEKPSALANLFGGGKVSFKPGLAKVKASQSNKKNLTVGGRLQVRF